MKMNFIGRSGLRVSNICMGTMTFGIFCDKKLSHKIMDYSYDNGINFFDTAELYPVPASSKRYGETEVIMSDWIKSKPRDSLIIASKVAGGASGWFVPPVRHGLTAIDRFHIKRAVEGSLKRLKTDYLDLYQVHWPDMVVPIEESLRALEDVVKEGKVRYIGTSNDSAYGLAKANEVSRFLNMPRFESIQNNFSLLNRDFLNTTELVCKNEQISLLPYSPLAGGVLTGKYNEGGNANDMSRFNMYMNDEDTRLRYMVYKFKNEKSLKATQRYMQIAKNEGVSVTELALAWTLHFDFVPSTIVGATNIEQIKEHLNAADIKLSSDAMRACDSVHEDIYHTMGV